MAKRAARKTTGRLAKRGAAKTATKRAAKRTARRKASTAAGRTRTTSPAKQGRSAAATRRAPASRAKTGRRSSTKAVSAKAVRTAKTTPKRRPATESRPVPTPPSSLNMNRRGSAARTGRAEIAEARQNLGSMGALTGGDVDADAENAYFSGEEAPGGDNPTPDQDIVDDIGRALGVEYQDNEELRGSDKVSDRDKHRWELDPASSEDYRDR